MLFAGLPYGIGLLTAGEVLAIMVLPFVASVSRDAFAAVPPLLKEAAYGVGATTWEVARNVLLPDARMGVGYGKRFCSHWAGPSAKRWRQPP